MCFSKTFKRVISVILSCALLLSPFPVSVLSLPDFDDEDQYGNPAIQILCNPFVDGDPVSMVNGNGDLVTFENADGDTITCLTIQ